MRIRPTAECVLQTRLGPVVYHVSSAHPKVYEAALHFGHALRRPGHRSERYMSLYNCYECLQPQRDLIFSSVRHSLSHARAALSRPRTLATLKVCLERTSRSRCGLGVHAEGCLTSRCSRRPR